MIKKNQTIWSRINWKKINFWKIITYIVFSLVLIFALAAILSKFSIFGIKLYTVQSGSMEPTIKTGSLVLTKFQNDYQVNDIVTFKIIENVTQNSKENTITHSINVISVIRPCEITNLSTVVTKVIIRYIHHRIHHQFESSGEDRCPWTWEVLLLEQCPDTVELLSEHH